MRRILIPALCLAVLCMCFADANAGALGQLYRNGQTVNELEDNDWEVLINYDDRTQGPGTVGYTAVDSTLDENDYLMGMLYIQQINDAVPGTATDDPRQLTTATGGFTGVFLVQVATKTEVVTPIGTQYFYTFQAAGTAAWSTLSAYLPTITDEGTLAVMFEDSDAFPFLDAEDTDVATSMGTAQNGTALWEFGFVGNPGEVWTASTSSDDVALISNGTIGGSNTFGAILNVTHDYMTSGMELLPHDYPNAGIFAQLHIDSGSISRVTTGPGAIGWEIETDADYYIKPTPEPGTFALLGLGLAACGVVIRRRRNKA